MAELRPTKTGIVEVDKALDEIRARLGKAERHIQYSFGADDLSTDTVDRYFSPWWEATAAGATEYKLVALHDGFLKNLRVRVATGGDTAGQVTVLVRVNGKDTQLSVTFEQKSSGVFVARSERSAPVKENDLISVAVRKSAAPATAQTNVTAQFELEY